MKCILENYRAALGHLKLLLMFSRCKLIFVDSKNCGVNESACMHRCEKWWN